MKDAHIALHTYLLVRKKVNGEFLKATVKYQTLRQTATSDHNIRKVIPLQARFGPEGG